MKEKEVKKDSATYIYELFEKGFSFLTTNEYKQNGDRCRDFYFGKQYDPITKETQDLPRPVFNMCKQQIDSKQANLVAQKSTLRFLTANNDQMTHATSQLANYLLYKQMRYDQYRSEFVKETLTVGTSVAHMYYSDKKFGAFGDYVGGMSLELINFENLVVSNPKNINLQEQEYIILKSRKTKKSLMALVGDDEEKKRKIADDTNSTGGMNQNTYDSDNVDTYLMYYRKDGEVYHRLSTRDVIVYDEKPLNPEHKAYKKIKPVKVDSVSIDYLDTFLENVDPEQMQQPDNELEENDVNSYQELKFYRYPVEVLVFNRKPDSIYGESNIRDILNTQKFINHTYAKQMQNMDISTNDKVVVAPDALRGQRINSKPGQVLTDYSKTGNGIRRLGGINALANGSFDVAEKAYNFSRSINQVNDVFLGQTNNSDLSGIAMQQAQIQNNMPIDDMRDKLFAFEAELGKTLELFIKMYYTQISYIYETKESEIIAKQAYNQMAQQQGLPEQPIYKTQEVTFDTEAIRNLKFYIDVEAVQSAKDSDTQVATIIQALCINGGLQNMDIHTREIFFKFYPYMSQELKDEMMALLKLQAQDYITQIQQQNQQLQEQILKLQNALQQSQQAVNYVGRVNQQLQEHYKRDVSTYKKDNNKLLNEIAKSGKGNVSSSNNDMGNMDMNNM